MYDGENILMGKVHDGESSMVEKECIKEKDRDNIWWWKMKNEDV